jgi:hypothetical protein
LKAEPPLICLTSNLGHWSGHQGPAIRCGSLEFWDHFQPSLGQQEPRSFIIGMLCPSRHIHAVPRMGIVLIYVVHERIPP